MTGCAGAGEVPVLSSLRSCCPCPPAEPWLAPPSRGRAGPDGSLAPCAAARGRLHNLLSPVQGSAQGQPLPHPKECRTKSMACEPGTVAASSIHRAIPSYPRGICHRAGRTLVRPLPPPCTQSQAWKTCKENKEAWSPDFTQQLCPLPVLHGEVTKGLGLGFTHLVDPGTLNKQLFGVFVCSKKVLLQSVEAKYTKCFKSPV